MLIDHPVTFAISGEVRVFLRNRERSYLSRLFNGTIK
jgi:hypothetical protein